MLSNRLLQLIWALVCVCVGTVNGAANIDILEPIVRVSPARSGDSLDLFGYSVILHQIAEPISGNFKSAIENTRYVRLYLIIHLIRLQSTKNYRHNYI